MIVLYILIIIIVIAALLRGTNSLIDYIDKRMP
jgi:hypothetical protein